MLAALKNYLSAEFYRDNSIKRGGQIDFVPLDLESGEERYLGEPVETLSAETIFDARWALTLLEEAMRRLREEYTALGKTNIIETLKPFLDPTNSKQLPSYEEAAAKLQVGLGAVKTLIHRLRKRYSEILREEVGRTVSDPEGVDDEIRALCEAIIITEGRLNL